MFGKLHRRGRMGSGMLVLLALVALSGWTINHQQVATAPLAGGPAPMGNTSVGGPTGATDSGKSPYIGNVGGPIIVGQSVKNDVSPPLRDIKPILTDGKGNLKAANDRLELIPLVGHKDVKDQVEQNAFAPGSNGPNPLIPATGVNFDGINSAGGCNGCAPPDTNGEVGQTQYVQTVNSSFAVWNKTGGQLLSPRNINTIWSGFGGPCQTRNDGDPVVIYDQFANRWVISQFTAASPYNECVAVSTSNDATGTWNRYAFQLSTTDFPDYPKLSVWPDGYYMSVNWFTGGQTYAGPRPYAFNRTQMINGAAATFQTTSAPLGSSVSPILPADLDGSIQPAAGTPNYFVGFGSSLALYKFHVDWTTPANTTWTNYANLSAAGFTQLCSATQDCVPQSGTTQKLDGLADRLMHRLAYRKFADGHESLVLNHSVQAGSGQAGVRWYEIRNPSTSPSIYQQSTYAPDTTWRWMGSVAMDQAGDMGLGFSASSSSIDPSIRYTGRLATDPLNSMSQGEGTILTGSGFQSGVNRWGDYSAMSVDPVDDCTFWYTQEYNNSGGWSWSTRIASFKFASCGGAPPPTATNTPVPPPTNTPLPTNTPGPGPTNTPTKTPVPPTNTPTPAPGGCGEKLTNGGFEAGPVHTGWTETSTGGYEIVDPTRPHTGSYSAYLAGYNNGTDTIYQQVAIPSTATSATLTYWWNVSTQEACCTAYDYLYAQVRDSSGNLLTTLQTLSNASPNNTWTKASFSLLAYKGQTVRVYFKGTNDVSLPTSFFVDDVSLNVCQ